MKRRVAIIVPALNEQATVGNVVRGCLRALSAERFDVMPIVIDDGSRDRTAEAAREAGATVIAHHTNRGVGRAFQSGLEYAVERDADYVVNIDADGQFSPEDITRLLDPLEAGQADVALASRFKDASLVPDMPWIKKWGNRWMSRLVSRIAKRRFDDVSCGFRAYNREASLRLNPWGDFTYTHESILELVAKRMRIVEIPTRVRGVREFGRSRVAGNLWRYALHTSHIILQTYRDYWPLHFFGWLSLLTLVPGLSLLAFLVRHRVTSGRFSPHIWSGFTGASLTALGILTLITGMLAEMLKRIRLNQENLIYLIKRERVSRATEKGEPGRR